MRVLGKLRGLLSRGRPAKAKRDAFLAWQNVSPGGSFAEFYVDQVSRKLAGRTDHPTLTIDGESEGQWNSGESMFEFLRAEGVVPTSRVLDYGCGSLRLGRHFIDYLETGRYFGLDVTDRFYSAGLELLDASLVERKRPELGLVGGPLHRRLEATPPDYAFCLGVMIHIPPQELGEFVETLSRLVGERTRLFLGTQVLPGNNRTIQKNKLTWIHSTADVEPHFSRCGLDFRTSACLDAPAGSATDHGDVPRRLFYELTRAWG